MNTVPIKTEINDVKQHTEKTTNAISYDQLSDGEPRNCSKENGTVMRNAKKKICWSCAHHRSRREFYMDVFD